MIEQAEVKLAYRRLARIHHPDVNPAGYDRASSEVFQAISHAYHVLSDDQRRLAYDRYGLAGGAVRRRSGAGAGRGGLRAAAAITGFATHSLAFFGTPVPACGPGPCVVPWTGQCPMCLGSRDGRGGWAAAAVGAGEPERGADVQAVVPISLREAALGGERTMQVGRVTGKQ